MYNEFAQRLRCRRLNRRGWLAASVIFLFAALLTPAQANTYYVGINGNDSRSATQAESSSTPWKTLQHAASLVVAGDTVQVLAGTYPSTGHAIVPANSGTSSAPITYNGQPGAVINGDPIAATDKSYLNIQGLEIENVGSSSSTGGIGISLTGCSNINVTTCHTYNTFSSGIAIWGVPWPNNPGSSYPSNHIYLAYNTIDRACNGGWNECITIANGVINTEVNHCLIEDTASVDTTNGGEGLDIKLAAYNIWIQDNEITGLSCTALMPDAATANDGGATSGLTNVYIFNNTIHDNNANGITLESEYYGSGQVGPLQNIQVYNNVVYNNALSGIDLQNYNNANATHNNIWVANNTFWNNLTSGGGNGEIVDWDNHATNVTITNNITGGSHGGWGINTNGYAATVEYNLTNDWGWYNGLTKPTTNRYTADPKFANPASGDYHLTSASTDAIGHGAASGLSGTNYDFDGNPRPTPGGGYDIGAFQY